MKIKNYLLILFLTLFIVGYSQKSDNTQAKSISLNLSDDSVIESSKKVFQSLNLRKPFEVHLNPDIEYKSYKKDLIKLNFL